MPFEMRVPNWLWPSRKPVETVPPDGFGQSLLDDARFVWRFRGCRQRSVAWRRPDDVERGHYDSHALFGRFGDGTFALANAEDRSWIVRERDWHGWPDPPQFVFFAVQPDGTIWCARDFHRWPQEWAQPADAL